MRCLVGCVVLSVAVFSQTGWGWGREGHQIVGHIAEARLTPRASEAIRELLGKGDLASISNWADQIRRDRKETATWHYVDIPFEMKSYDPQRDGKDGNNVIEKVISFAQVLNDRTADRKERIEALRFLVHFVGDLHQPLHCAERNEDKGGNFCKVTVLDDPEMSNLHRIWDTTLLKRSMVVDGKELKPKEYADKLNEAITPDMAKKWMNQLPREWADQAHQLAVQVVYAGIPINDEPTRIDDKYIANAQPVIDQQLQRGGVRLAEVLNRIFP